MKWLLLVLMLSGCANIAAGAIGTVMGNIGADALEGKLPGGPPVPPEPKAGLTADETVAFMAKYNEMVDKVQELSAENDDLNMQVAQMHAACFREVHFPMRTYDPQDMMWDRKSMYFNFPTGFGN